jgi:hypothetical protein
MTQTDVSDTGREPDRQAPGSLQPPFGIIRKELYAGAVVPFLGSGASISRSKPKGGQDPSWDRCPPFDERGAKCYPRGGRVCEERGSSSGPALPTATELSCLLARQANFPRNEHLDLAKVAQYYGVVGGRDDLTGTLHAIFDNDWAPTPLHDLLARVEQPLIIVTTNYDDLIERAFDNVRRSYDLVVHTTEPSLGDQVLWWRRRFNEKTESDSDKAAEVIPIGGDGTWELETISPNRLYIDIGRTSVIYKMHGAVDRSARRLDQYVITEDDYVDFLVRMTGNAAIPAVFAEPFKERRFLFLGYGLSDWNWRVVLNRLERDTPPAANLAVEVPKAAAAAQNIDPTSKPHPVVQQSEQGARRRRPPFWAIQRSPSELEKLLWLTRGVTVWDMAIEDFVRNLKQI